MGLENKNWDSLSDSTILVETQNWFVNICLLPYKTPFTLLSFIGNGMRFENVL